MPFHLAAVFSSRNSTKGVQSALPPSWAWERQTRPSTGRPTSTRGTATQLTTKTGQPPPLSHMAMAAMIVGTRMSEIRLCSITQKMKGRMLVRPFSACCEASFIAGTWFMGRFSVVV